MGRAVGWRSLGRGFRSLRLAPEQARFADEIQRVLVDELYERAKVSLFILVAAFAALIHVLGPAFGESPAVEHLFYALFVVVGLRYAVILFVGTGPSARGTPAARHLAFAIGSTAVGVLMGWVNVLAFPVMEAARFGLYAMTLTGISSVALVSMGTSPAVYIAYVVPSLGPLAVVSALATDQTESAFVPVMLVLYISALIAMSLRDYISRRDNILLRLQLADLALHDSLTSLRNRRYLTEFMPQEVEQLLRTHQLHGSEDRSLALMMLDLDHFKTVNDRHGHDAGDVVLREFATILRESVRKPDVVARWGGEEFVVVARGLGGSGAAALATRIRERLAAHDIELPSGARVRCTCSIGYALLPFLLDRPASIGWQEALAMADAAMYQAKQRGRDCALGVFPAKAQATSPTELVDAVKRDLASAEQRGLVRLELVSGERARGQVSSAG